jgi:transcriptional regulator with XRE-family HTH domain
MSAIRRSSPGSNPTPGERASTKTPQRILQMPSPVTQPISTSPSAGVLLRRWRELRGKTQLALSLETGVSQKHISFMESGRSAPSRDMLLVMAEALDMPLRDRNALLTGGGYAPVYAEGALDGPATKSVGAALRRLLRLHEPYPAVVMDRHWNVLMANDAAPRLFGCFIDLDARPRPRNLLHLMFDPDGLRPFIVDWPQVSRSLLARVRREAVGRVVDLETRRLLDTLLRYPDVEPGWDAAGEAEDLPMVPLSFRKDGVQLDYFSMVTTVGAPRTISAQELRLECMFPVDDDTEKAHGAFVRAHASTFGRPPKARHDD